MRVLAGVPVVLRAEAAQGLAERDERGAPLLGAVVGVQTSSVTLHIERSCFQRHWRSASVCSCSRLDDQQAHLSAGMME